MFNSSYSNKTIYLIIIKGLSLSPKFNLSLYFEFKKDLNVFL